MLTIQSTPESFSNRIISSSPAIWTCASRAKKCCCVHMRLIMGFLFVHWWCGQNWCKWSERHEMCYNYILCLHMKHTHNKVSSSWSSHMNIKSDLAQPSQRSQGGQNGLCNPRSIFKNAGKRLEWPWHYCFGSTHRHCMYAGFQREGSVCLCCGF